MKVPQTKNFSPELDEKFACTCCGDGGLSIATLILLETIKTHYKGAIVHIHSAARCKQYNSLVGGSKKSEHLSTLEEPLVDAVDIHVEGVSVQELYLYLKSLPYANLLGIGKYIADGFVHVDTRGYGARWVG